MVVCLVSKASFAKTYQIKNHSHFCNIFSAYLVENQFQLPGKAVNRTIKIFFPLVTNFSNLFFAIIFHKKSHLSGKIDPCLKTSITKIV